MSGGALRFWTALAGPALVSLIPMAVAPALPAMAQEFAAGHDGALFAQMIMTMPAIMLILGAPLASLACERIGIRPTFLAAAALFTVAGGAGLLVDGFAALAASRLLLGLAGGAIQTCTLALVGRWYQEDARHAVLGWMVSLASAVAIAGLILGGWLVDIAGWRGPFALYLLGLVLLLLGVLAVERHAPGEHVAEDSGGFRPLLPLWPFYLAILALTLAMFMPGIQGPFLIAERGTGSAALSGLIVAASPIGAVLSSAGFATIRRHASERAVLGLTALLLGGGCVMAAMAGSTAGIVAGFFVTGLGAGMVEPNIGSIILGRSPHALHARASSLMISAMFLGQFLNPLAADPLHVGFGTAGAFLGIGGATLAAGLVALLAARRRPVPA
ncbi:Predicted arabinose efflux permease, MFS family [Sphingomonas laterariae]|uniref:Predicted arabinose efflux permease, MFS family n=1 Tax=Edaphosphingomonas laterariae TaxID=861865 RepID=A0A239D1B9_9SPHN|nr:MFS transporter [Sphingomonas laterariae]SNS25671.1 Predicted arabinose efflux permease, MFS family [Sphingomonas laterariae]